MKFTKKEFFLFIIPISFVLFFEILDILIDKRDIRNNTEKEISGIVERKYHVGYIWSRDKIPMLKISNSTSTMDFNILGWCRRSSFYDYVSVGDSISKPSESLQLIVFKPSGEVKLFRYCSIADIEKRKKLFW